MPAAARSLAQDDVFSKTGVGKFCARPVQTVTGEGSPNVYANSFGIVRQGDKVGLHAAGGCSPDLSVLTTFSSTVFINGRGAGRIGDQYTADNIIISGSYNVFIGG